VFFVEAKYHNSPKRAGEQVRYIAHREEGLQRGERRELYGIGSRYRALRGDEAAIRRAMIEDGRGLRKPVYFRFIFSVDDKAAERFARLDERLGQRVIRDAVEKTFRGAARGAQGVFAIHQHGGVRRVAHPHVHALLSPRFEDRSPVYLSGRTIQLVKTRWEREILNGLARLEQRLRRQPDRVPLEPPAPPKTRDRVPLEALTPPPRAERAPEPRPRPQPNRRPRPLDPLGVLFLRGPRALRRAAFRGRFFDLIRRSEVLLWASRTNPERAARRATFRLATRLMPEPIREALLVMRGLRGIGVRQR